MKNVFCSVFSSAPNRNSSCAMIDAEPHYRCHPLQSSPAFCRLDLMCHHIHEHKLHPLHTPVQRVRHTLQWMYKKGGHMGYAVKKTRGRTNIKGSATILGGAHQH